MIILYVILGVLFAFAIMFYLYSWMKENIKDEILSMLENEVDEEGYCHTFFGYKIRLLIDDKIKRRATDYFKESIDKQYGEELKMIQKKLINKKFYEIEKKAKKKGLILEKGEITLTQYLRGFVHYRYPAIGYILKNSSGTKFKEVKADKQGLNEIEKYLDNLRS